MTTIDEAAVRERLEGELETVDAELARLRDDMGRSIEESTDEDGNDSHLGDSATETHDREVEMTMEDTLGHRRDEIRSALARLDEGTYGLCGRCGKPIGAERLEALPFATKCIECKRLEERG